MAFLISERGYNLRDAFLAVKQARPMAGPNVGFWKTLQSLSGAGDFSLHEYLVLSLEEMGFDKTKAETLLKQHDGDFDLTLNALIRDLMKE